MGDSMFEKVIGIDLGTSNIAIYKKRKGMILREPSVVAIDRETREVLSFGNDAKAMFGRTPDRVEIIHPIRKGVVADFDITDQLINYLMKKAKVKSSFLKSKIVMSIPLDITKVEENAFREISERMGSREVYLVDSVNASSLGVGLDINYPTASMIVDIGGGKTDIAILSLGKIVKGTKTDIAGELFDRRIVSYIKQKYKLLIGEKTAEELKINGSSLFEGEKETEVRGRDLITNLPHEITITSKDLKEALQEDIYSLIDLIKDFLEDIHPEMAADIMKNGMILTGGCASLEGLDKLLSYELGIPVHRAHQNETSTIEGIGILLENLSYLKK